MEDLSEKQILLKKQLQRLRGDPLSAPDASIVIPVNAQNDVSNVYRLISDIAGYAGAKVFEIILVINNYPVDNPPREVEMYEQMGVKVIGIPHVEHEGEVIIAARIPGIRLAISQVILLFDADCRIPKPTNLFDWYVSEFANGCDLAYTHVDYTDLPPAISVKARIFVHHASRWFRRTILHIPTSRGSNYAIRKELILELFRNRRILHEIQVGPAIKSIGGKISYSGAKDLVVLTSGRFFSQGWKVLITYLIWRIRFYLRVFRMKSNSAIPPE